MAAYDMNMCVPQHIKNGKLNKKCCFTFGDGSVHERRKARS